MSTAPPTSTWAAYQELLGTHTNNDPAAKADGNFILGPTHNAAPEMTAQDSVPQGSVFNFTMESADSKIYPGIARDAGTFGTVDPTDPAKLIVTTSHPAAYTRKVAVYVPKQYVAGTAAPFIVGARKKWKWEPPISKRSPISSCRSAPGTSISKW